MSARKRRVAMKLSNLRIGTRLGMSFGLVLLLMLVGDVGYTGFMTVS
jgi:hypothetical protein